MACEPGAAGTNWPACSSRSVSQKHCRLRTRSGQLCWNSPFGPACWRCANGSSLALVISGEYAAKFRSPELQ
jgi:hypothetical protein